MHVLIIGSQQLRQQFADIPEDLVQIKWSHDFLEAMQQLSEVESDAVVLDTRTFAPGSLTKLGQLLSELSVTTRVLAIVEQLPDGELFSASGVVYLTPPVNISDIGWFVRSQLTEIGAASA